MTHLIVCREYPPAPYPPGGIGTYVVNIARLLVDAGETVHIIAQRWRGAPAHRTESDGGRLIVHRVSVDQADSMIVKALAESDCPSQTFAWQAALLAESLIESEPIDVIEGQEWEAPLYYLQLRRAMGLGPRRQPPCLVHLHSPSELIFQHNQWDPTLTDFVSLRKLERYSIRAADAVLCPSQYLAEDAERLFDLAPGSVHVIRYPLGGTPVLERTDEVWARDCVGYFGRIELRKGVAEWVDAAVRVASSHPAVTFEFVGSDTSLTGAEGQSVLEFLKQRIPRRVRARFRFRGSRNKKDLLRFLATVPVVAVPSRWDNLPHTCIEAMCTGAPVLVSPNGGMRELVSNNRSGWVASDASASGLESALRKFLGTPPQTRAAMGSEAARTIREICANDTVVESHLELRASVARAGIGRSTKVPASTARRGAGFVITCGDSSFPDFQQTSPARAVVLVAHSRHKSSAKFESESQRRGWEIVYTSDPSLALTREAGVQALLAAAPDLRTIVFLSARVRLDPGFVDACESVFENQPDVATLSPWMRYENPDGRSWFSLGAADDQEFPECVAVRADALPSLASVPDAVVYPAILATVTGAPRKPPARATRYSVMAGAQFSSSGLPISRFLAAPWRDQVKLATLGLKQPGRAARWMAMQARGLAGKILEPRGENVR